MYQDFRMFSFESSIKSTLLCGHYDLTKLFTFEAAMHWALEGRHVLYITPAPLTSIPAKYHDRNPLVVESFHMVKFMYLNNYEALIDLLVDLHTHHTLPGVLLIDKLDAYIDDPKVSNHPQNVHIAKLCSILHETMNACARVLKNKKIFYLLASVSPKNYSKSSYHFYFKDIWKLEDENNESFSLIRLTNSSRSQDVLKYKKFRDETLILERILKKFED